MHEPYHRERIVLAVGQKVALDGLPSLRRCLGVNSFEVRNMRLRSILHLAQPRVVQFGRDRGNHRFDRPRPHHLRVVVAAFRKGPQVNNAFHDGSQLLGEVRKARDARGQDRPLKATVGKYRADSLNVRDQRFCERAHRRLAREV